MGRTRCPRRRLCRRSIEANWTACVDQTPVSGPDAIPDGSVVLPCGTAPDPVWLIGGAYIFHVKDQHLRLVLAKLYFWFDSNY